MPVEVTADGSPPTVVKLAQTGFHIGASDAAAPAVEHVYVLADTSDGVYQYRQPASGQPTDSIRRRLETTYP